jgi:hypothetical protein
MKFVCHVVPPRPPHLIFAPLGHGEHAMIRGAPWAQSFIDELIATCFPGQRCGLVFVSLLAPGQVIPEHTDRKDGDCRNRIHVPISTNPQCYFRQLDKNHHIPVGSAWSVDPTLPHGVENRGLTDRIHLMFNVIDQEGPHG